jgi:hypothetical protein
MASIISLATWNRAPAVSSYRVFKKLRSGSFKRLIRTLFSKKLNYSRGTTLHPETPLPGQLPVENNDPPPILNIAAGSGGPLLTQTRSSRQSQKR